MVVFFAELISQFLIAWMLSFRVGKRVLCLWQEGSRLLSPFLMPLLLMPCRRPSSHPIFVRKFIKKLENLFGVLLTIAGTFTWSPGIPSASQRIAEAWV
ncbi:hypothetical protein LINPERHAP1_LOCUS37903 [Linum perenne]